MRRFLLFACLCLSITAAPVHAQVRVLLYHAHPNLGYVESTFVAHMDFLKNNGYHTITPTQLIDWMKNGTPLPIRPVLLTVDDNYILVYRSMYPILSARGLKAVNFVITNSVGGGDDTTYIHYCDWDEIRAMDASGTIINESHTLTHPQLTQISSTQERNEVRNSRTALNSNITGKDCRFLAYPYGDYNADTIAQCVSGGYTAAFSTINTPVLRTSPLYEIPRMGADGVTVADVQNILGHADLPPAPPGPGYTIDDRSGEPNYYADAAQWQWLDAPGTAYGAGYHWRNPGTGSVTTRWAAILPAAGTYRVHARWVAAAGRATNATYRITHAGGVTPVSVNQQTAGSQWNLLGTFSFTATDAAQVTLGDDANGVVVADGIWFEPVTSGVADYALY